MPRAKENGEKSSRARSATAAVTRSGRAQAKPRGFSFSRQSYRSVFDVPVQGGATPGPGAFFDRPTRRALGVGGTFRKAIPRDWLASAVERALATPAADAYDTARRGAACARAASARVTARPRSHLDRATDGACETPGPGEYHSPKRLTEQGLRGGRISRTRSKSLFDLEAISKEGRAGEEG